MESPIGWTNKTGERDSSRVHPDLFLVTKINILWVHLWPYKESIKLKITSNVMDLNGLDWYLSLNDISNTNTFNYFNPLYICDNGFNNIMTNFWLIMYICVYTHSHKNLSRPCTHLILFISHPFNERSMQVTFKNIVKPLITKISKWLIFK